MNLTVGKAACWRRRVFPEAAPAVGLRSCCSPPLGWRGGHGWGSRGHSLLMGVTSLTRAGLIINIRLRILGSVVLWQWR